MASLHASGVQKQMTSITQSTIQACNVLSMSLEELLEHVQEAAMENPLISFESIPLLSPYGTLVDSHGFREAVVDFAPDIGLDRNFFSNNHKLIELLCMQIPNHTGSEQRRIIGYIINSLDEDGYFRENEEETVKRLGCDTQQLHAALKLVQRMEPPGIAARNLRECLLIQLKRIYPDETLAYMMVEECFDQLSKNQLKAIAKSLRCSISDICQALETLRKLECRPARQYAQDAVRYIIPDITIAGYEDNFTISLNKEASLSIQLDKDYELSACGDDLQAQRWMAEKKRQASALQLFIQKRNSTLLLVCGEIFRAQKPFFFKGPEYLRPLKQKEIATALNCHESTVFRAVKGKYLSCSWGTFPLTYFFSNTIDCEDGYDACNPKQMIRSIIEAENKAHPISDGEIAKRLMADGVKISRRTVAKYRDEAGIPVVSLRKKYE